MHSIFSTTGGPSVLLSPRHGISFPVSKCVPLSLSRLFFLSVPQVGDQVLSLNGVQWAKFVDEEDNDEPVIEPGMRLEAAVQSILRSTQSSRNLRFRIRSTGKVPSASVVRSSASMITRRPSSYNPDSEPRMRSQMTGDTSASVSGQELRGSERERRLSSSPSSAAAFLADSDAAPAVPASAYVRKKSLIPFSRCSFRSDSRVSSSSASTSDSSRRQREQPQLQQTSSQQQQVTASQAAASQQQQLSLVPTPDQGRRLSSMEMSPLPPSSPLSPTPQSRHPSFSQPILTPFDLELRRILTESESGTFYYFRNEYLMGRLPVTSLVNFLKQFLDRIEHRHALIRLVHEHVIRPDEKDLFRRLVSASFSMQHIPLVSQSQFDPRRQSTVAGVTGMQQQFLQQQALQSVQDPVHGLSSDDEDFGSQRMRMESANSESKRRMSTTSVTSMGNEGGNDGSSLNVSSISRNRRCSSLHISNPGKRLLPGIPLTASDLNLNPGTANPRRASIMSNTSAGGHHLLPIPPPMKQQMSSSSSLAPPSAASLSLKRHSTSRLESTTLGVPVLDEGQRRHSSSALGVNQSSSGQQQQQLLHTSIPMITNVSCDSLNPQHQQQQQSRRRYDEVYNEAKREDITTSELNWAKRGFQMNS